MRLTSSRPPLRLTSPSPPLFLAVAALRGVALDLLRLLQRPRALLPQLLQRDDALAQPRLLDQALQDARILRRREEPREGLHAVVDVLLLLRVKYPLFLPSTASSPRSRSCANPADFAPERTACGGFAPPNDLTCT